MGLVFKFNRELGMVILKIFNHFFFIVHLNTQKYIELFF